MPKHSVLLLKTAFERVGTALAAAAPDVDIITMDDAGNFAINGQPCAAEDIAPTVVWMGLDFFRCAQGSTFTRATTRAESVQWLQTALAGVETPLFKDLLDRGVRLCNSDAQAPSIADFVLGTVLAHFQRYAHRLALQAEKAWQPFEFRELAGTHWLIVGYGSIGEAVAKRAHAFDARVTGVRRQPQPTSWAELITPDELPQHLPSADVVVLACALTDATRSLVDAGFLAAMKSQAVLVNVGRGALVVDADLLAALDRGHIAHAILDVFDPEPLPESHPYWGHPRVLATSHSSSFGDGMAARGDALFLENLRRFLAGEPLHKEVHAIP